MLARTLQKPVFVGGLDPIRLNELDLLQRASADLSGMLLRLAAAGTYGDMFADQLSPIKLDVVRQASDDLIQRCYRSSFVPETSALIAVGDVTLDELRTLAEPEGPSKLTAAFDSGDHIHPNDAGYEVMANAIDLTKLSQRSAKKAPN